MHSARAGALAAGGPTPNLTLEEARARAQVVKGPAEYDLVLKLAAESSGYRGELRLTFELTEVPRDLALDYQGRKVKEFEVNGHRLDPAKLHKKNRLKMPGKDLRTGANYVKVAFESDYDNDGAGLHKSVDPADGREYFYACLEPYDCNRIFPCFDQPDIKGTYALTVHAPAEWEVTASGAEVSRRDVGDTRVRVFKKTPPFSTYIFGLCAGPYAVFTDPEARIPSKIFAPQSAADRVDVAELFEITRQGFDFFEGYFEIPYPFEKYDQIFCPQFNWGAMENVACVTFNDRYLWRHEPTLVERQRRANTVLHEMAHMWFGNLVTMDWWNDLWLNESFATYMANLALVKATRFTAAWDAFYQATKSWAYWQDELPTTHPIETPVPDTDTTHTNFDGITYGKGASVLKQLAFYLGDEPFRKGVASYLKQYSWKNATREDFLRHLAKAAGRDMKRWTRLWLLTSGTNTLTPAFKTDGKKITRFEVVQGAGNGDAERRPHAIEVGLYKRKRGGGVREYARATAQVDVAKSRVKALEGKPAPDFVFANVDDQAFAKVFLDDASLAFAREHLEELPGVMLRGAVWKGLWGMIRDGGHDPRALPELFVAKAPREPASHVLQGAFANVKAVVDRYLPGDERAPWVARLQALAWDAVREAAAGSDVQKVWFQALVATAEEGEALERLNRMLHGQEYVPGVELDQDKRWALVTRLAAAGDPRAAEFLVEEERRDKSEKGQGQAIAVRAAAPDAAAKAAAWNRFVDDKDTPLALLRTGMTGFWQPGQADLLAPYVKAFFREVPGIEKGRGPYFTDAFVEYLYPALAVSAKTKAAAEKVVKSKKKIPVGVRRALVEKTYELELALAARGR